jgi:hypothetical protein
MQNLNTHGSDNNIQEYFQFQYMCRTIKRTLKGRIKGRKLRYYKVVANSTLLYSNEKQQDIRRTQATVKVQEVK